MIRVDDILLYLTGHASSELEAQIQHWMAEDPIHLQEFEMYAKIWNQSGSLQQYKVLDTQSAWSKIEHLIVEDAPQKQNGFQGYTPNIHDSDREMESRDPEEDIPDTDTSFRRRRLWRRIAVAASILLVASVGAFFLLRPSYIEISGEELAMQAGDDQEGLTITLSDGSVITLADENSSVIYPRKIKTSDTERRIKLKNGSATFDIATDPERPFIVESYPAAVTVLGTIFSTETDSIVSTVANKEGLVRFSDIDNLEEGVEVKEGESFSYDGEEFKDETPREPPPPPPPPRGTLEKIGNIVDELTYRYPIRLEFSPYIPINLAGIARIDYKQPLDSIIMQLDSTAVLEYTRKGNLYTIRNIQPKN